MGCVAVKDLKNPSEMPKCLPEHRSTIANLILTSKENIRNSYIFLKSLGQGGYGSVRKVKHVVTSTYRAVKSISIKSMTRDQMDFILKEIKILKKLDHPGIIKIYEVFTEENFVHIVTELCTGGDLFDKIARTRCFSENMAGRYLFDIVSIIKYCHDNHIVHRDLKPENLLFEDNSNNARLKLIDFGTSVEFTNDQHMDKIVGTPFYIAPEVLEGKYNQLCDVWSIGVILYIMLCGKPPFKGKNHKEIFLKIKTKQLNFKGKVWRSVSPLAKKLLKKLLKKDPNSRISITELFYHPWVQTRAENLVPDKVLANKFLKNLMAFKSSNNLITCTLAFLAHCFTPDEDLKEIRKLFESLDKNGDGRLSHKEIYHGLSEFGVDFLINPDEIIQNCDLDQNGFIDYSEFLTGVMSKNVETSKNNLLVAFKALDKDGSGTISVSELLFALNGTSSEENILKLLAEIDSNGDGEIDLEEFTQAVLKSGFTQ